MSSPEWLPKSISKNEPPLALPKAIWQVLAARGVKTKQEVEELLAPKLKDLRNPFCLDGMERAVERLIEAYQNDEKICVYADFDLDGTSGLALFRKALEDFGYQHICHYQPKRLSEGYGFHSKVVERLAEEGVSLIVTIDVGITAVDAVETAKEHSVDVIITDHHLPKETLPDALTVINPNKGNCPSELGHLCGAGVAFYLALALKLGLEEAGADVSQFDPKSLLDCYAIATLTDMVPLVDENRALVRHGLVALSQTKRPGLRSLMKALDLWGRPLTSQDVGMRLAPKLNALSRLEKGLLPLDLYLVDSEEEADRLVAEVIENNSQRVLLQRSAEQQALDALEANPPKTHIWLWSKDFHRGVVGLVATKMVQKFGLPAFIGSVNENGVITGSARAPDGAAFSLLDAFAAGEAHLNQFGGHAAAAGFEIDQAQVEAFDQALAGYFGQIGAGPAASIGRFEYDAMAHLEEINPQFMKWYQTLEPFGVHFESPLFLVPQLEVKGMKELRGGHLKLTLAPRMSQYRLEALWFSPPPRHPVMVQDRLEVGQLIDVLAEPQWNYFAGRKSLQLLLRDVRWAQAGIDH